jgi:hypothetical protein
MCQIGIQHVKDSLRQRGAPPEILLGGLVMLIIALVLSFTIDGNPLLLWGMRALAAVTLLILLYKAGLYFCPPFLRWYTRRQSKRMLMGLHDRRVEWIFYEDRLETHSSTTTRTLTWSQLQRVVIHPEIWLLIFRPQPILYVPSRFLPAEMQSLIRQKAGEVGANVRDRT